MAGNLRVLDRQRHRRRGKKFWPLLALVLLGLNIYLFGVRGLPGLSEHPSSPASGAVGPPAERAFVSGLGEMRGVAGIRDAAAGQDAAAERGAAGRLLPRFALAGWSSQRFDLERAGGVAGQRRLEQWCHRVHGTVARGDSFSTALSHGGIAPNEVFDLVQALKPVFDFRRCRAGDRFDALLTPGGQIQRFAYHESPLISYRVERHGRRLDGRRVEEQADREVASIAVRIEGSLWQSLERAGERGALVMMLVDIFAWDIDFYVDTHPGDQIRLLVEKYRVDGRFARYGRILAAEYRGDVGVHRAFWFDPRPDDEDATQGYFDEQGGSLRKAFLKSPLKYAHISSRYGMRVHPVLGFTKMHLGVDFAAPIGTPVWAPADGTVLVAGRHGASGIMIKLRHANGYQTVFCHLSRIDKSVRIGGRVRQKQVIGRVGSTGRSTGPHLHYGMSLRGRNVNPLAQRFPPAKPVPAAEMAAYRRAIAPLVSRLDGISAPAAERTTARRPQGPAQKEAG